MHDWESQSHVRWDCKYHVVIVPKYRRKALYGKLRRQVLNELTRLTRDTKQEESAPRESNRAGTVTRRRRRDGHT